MASAGVLMIAAGCETPGHQIVPATEANVPPELVSGFKVRRDDVRAITYYFPNENLKTKANRLYAYVAHPRDEAPILFFRARVSVVYGTYGSGAHFLKSGTVNVDGKPYPLEGTFEYGGMDWTGVACEYIDFTEQSHPELASALLSAEGPVLYQLVGLKGALSFKMPSSELPKIKQAARIRDELARR